MIKFQSKEMSWIHQNQAILVNKNLNFIRWKLFLWFFPDFLFQTRDQKIWNICPFYFFCPLHLTLFGFRLFNCFPSHSLIFNYFNLRISGKFVTAKIKGLVTMHQIVSTTLAKWLKFYTLKAQKHFWSCLLKSCINESN